MTLSSDTKAAPADTGNREVVAKNVAGSTAGASSGDFHVYRQQRRKEQERMDRMHRDAEDQRQERERVDEMHRLKVRDEERTIKRAAKRRRKKERREKAIVALRRTEDGNGKERAE